MSDQQMCSKQKAGAWSLKLKSIDRNDKISPHRRKDDGSLPVLLAAGYETNIILNLSIDLSSVSLVIL